MALVAVVGSSSGPGVLGWLVRTEVGPVRYLGQTEIGGPLWLVPGSGKARAFRSPGEAIQAAREAARRYVVSLVVEEWAGTWSAPQITVEGSVGACSACGCRFIHADGCEVLAGERADAAEAALRRVVVR